MPHKRHTLHPHPETQIQTPKPETLYLSSRVLHKARKRAANDASRLNPKPQIPNPKPQTPNPNLRTPGPTPYPLPPTPSLKLKISAPALLNF